MQYKMLKKSGALQEGIRNILNPSSSDTLFRQTQTGMTSVRGGKRKDYHERKSGVEVSCATMERHASPEQDYFADMEDDQGIDDGMRQNRIPDAIVIKDVTNHSRSSAVIKKIPQPEEPHFEEIASMFFYTIPEGQRVLVTDKQGHSEIIIGPRRIFRWGKRFAPLSHFIAYPGEFLIIKRRDGSQEHVPGPREEWLDPRVIHAIEKAEALQLSAKEAVVVYAKGPEREVSQRIVVGPALFVPNPGEWLHTFSWHGSKEGSYQKVPGGLTFQKLWLMPDQMYHDAEEVRTSDDVVLTIKLMLFFELRDVEKMLAGTHDPIGDFINATSSDVIDLVAHYTFDEFKLNSHKLNELQSYAQLINRAEQVGYKINKVVYRGYITAAALQKMHEQSIETRTRLKLERETEEQSQKLADFKQECELQRLVRQRNQDKEQAIHEMEKEKLHHHQETELYQYRCKIELAEKQHLLEQQVQFFQQLKQMGVDLTLYLTQQRADQVIELRGNTPAPHLHLPTEKASRDSTITG